jgi:hypothetical protein
MSSHRRNCVEKSIQYMKIVEKTLSLKENFAKKSSKILMELFI